MSAPTLNKVSQLLVKRIYQYYRTFGYETEIMAASFRNTGEVLELAGCDLLTISPKLLEELRRNTDPVEVRLTPESAKTAGLERVSFDEKSFLSRIRGSIDELTTAKRQSGRRDRRPRPPRSTRRWCRS